MWVERPHALFIALFIALVLALAREGFCTVLCKAINDVNSPV